MNQKTTTQVFEKSQIQMQTISRAIAWKNVLFHEFKTKHPEWTLVGLGDPDLRLEKNGRKVFGFGGYVKDNALLMVLACELFIEEYEKDPTTNVGRFMGSLDLLQLHEFLGMHFEVGGRNDSASPTVETFGFLAAECPKSNHTTKKYP